MTKFIQICASQNDLFALDAEGSVYQYDFNATTWVELVPSRGDEDAPERLSATRRGARRPRSMVPG